MKKYGSILCCLIAGVMSAQIAQADVLLLSDEIMAIADGNTSTDWGNSANTATLGPDNSATFRYTARERDNTGQTNRRVATFLKYDISSLTAADVNNAGFTATFQIEHLGRLNDLNNGMNLMFGRVDGGDWTDDGSSNPDFAWGLASADQETLLVNMINYPSSTNLQVDVSAIVKDWVLGNTDNYGFALFGADNGGNSSNGSYLDNASLTTAIPEPATLGLISVFGGGILFIRRRFMM